MAISKTVPVDPELFDLSTFEGSQTVDGVEL